MSATISLKLEGLNCAHCAGKIEEKVKKLDDVQEASINLVGQEIKIKYSGSKDGIIKRVDDITQAIEPGVKVFEYNKSLPQEEEGSSKQRVARLCVGAVVFLAGMLLGGTGLQFPIFLTAYIILGYDVILTALRNIVRGSVFDENFLMSISTVGAFAIGEYPEGVAVMLFYQIGEYFQNRAVEKSRKSIKNLMGIKPEFANLIDEVGEASVVNPEDVGIGALILVKPGEKIPLDGVVVSGRSQVDQSSLTGESVPIDVEPGSEILSGAVNMNGILHVRVSKDYVNSTVYKILELVENSAAKKAPVEKFITKFSRYYTPAVVLSAVVLAFVPPLVIPQAEFSDWIYRALVFLVVSCPCALVISVPLTFMSGIGLASRRGALIKGGNYLQVLSQIDTVVFDKTGTLTKGTFEVTGIFPASGVSEKELLSAAYAVEKYSNHPIAKSVTAECMARGLDAAPIAGEAGDFGEIPGRGMRVVQNGTEILAGNAGLMREQGIGSEIFDGADTAVYVAKDKKYLGHIVISDTVREDSHRAIEELKRIGISKIVMLTGDTKRNAQRVASELSIPKVYSELLPNEKVKKLEELYKENPISKIVFVGDGINDSPVLARADVGIAMGGVGSDAAIEVADIVIVNDELSKIPEAVSIARSTMAIVKQNIIFALGVKFLVLILGALGIANMWMAVFADVGVTFLVVLNSMRRKY